MKGQISSIFFSRLLEDNDVAEFIRKEAEKNSVKAGMFILIGALKHAVLGCYKDGEYIITELSGPLEVASCMGNVSLDEKSEIAIHAHMVVSNDKCKAFGGHLMKGCIVGPTAELVMIEASGMDLKRAFDERTKLKLLSLG